MKKEIGKDSAKEAAAKKVGSANKSNFSFRKINKENIRKFFGSKRNLAVSAIALVLIALFTVFTVGIYRFGWTDDATVEAARIIPYPAVLVNGHIVSYAKYVDYKKAYTTYIQEFYIKGQKNLDPNSKKAKQILSDADSRVKTLLVQNAIIEQEVKSRDIKYTQKDVDDSFNQFVKNTGGAKEVANNLKKYYGLTTDKFKEEFFIDTFLSGKLQNAIQNDAALNNDAKKKAEDVLSRVKAGQDFATLAKKYSDDTATASKGGDLGYVKKGTLVPEFEGALWKLQKVGDVSGLVKTVYGYHIIKLTGINGDQRQASHILIKTKDFDTWLADRVKAAKISYWVK